MTVRTDITCLSLMMRTRMASGRTTCRRQVSRCKMTLCTGHTGVVMLGNIVIRVVTEYPRLPYGRVMTCIAGACSIIISRYVIRILGTIVISKMARITIHRRSCILAAGVTADASRGCMFPCQREASFAVIERCRFPPSHRMAGKTRMIECIGHMVRIGNSGEVGCVAIVTDRGRSFELTVLVAVTARYGSMSSEQRERCGAVIKRGRLPCRGGMARKTIV